MTDNRNTESEFGELRPHVVDGIQEADNPLPTWWVGLFVGCVIFAVVYMTYFYILGGKSQEETFNLAMKQRVEQMKKADASNDSGPSLEERLKSPEYVEAGLTLYTANCAPCHGPQGQGVIGPNLTDSHWIHGGSSEDIIKILEIGVLAKGMPAWKDVLGTKKIEQLTALIESWRDKNLPGKEAQGEVYEPGK